MNLKQIEMVGFKSFADQTKITFEDGINAIVGPNGCGKSNVADAIKWVLGEQSSKNLRGSNMQDVIFKGTEKRKGLNFCEVSLCFDNRNKIFNSPFDDIKITRKLYKTGDSEYLINDNNCRLKEIIEMLHNSGIGKSGYSIISQGMVEKIVNSKPDDRRSIFEEAAGIAGFKAKKVEAERKLEKTKINLDTINNVLSEVERQLTPLKKQSETAKIYLELKEKLKALEINAYLYQYDNASVNKDAIKSKIDAILEQIQLRQKELDTATENYNVSFDKLNNNDDKIKELNSKILEITVNMEKQTGQANVIKEKVGHLKNEKTRIDEELGKFLSNKEQLENLLSIANKNKLSKEEQLTNLKAEVAELEQSFFAISLELQSGENEAIEAQKKLFDSLNKLGDVKAKISALNAEKTTYIENLKNSNLNKENIEFKIKDLEKNKVLSFNRLDVEKNKKSKITDELNLKIVEQNKLLTNIKIIENDINELNANIVSMHQRKKILEDMQKEYEGFGGSVKRLLSDANNNDTIKEKIVGVVASLITVPSKFQTAMEMALGNAVQNVVCETEDNAKQLISYLKQHEYGRVTFLPINSVKPRIFDTRFNNCLNMQGSLGVAKDLVLYNRKIEKVISSLLGNTLIVDDINNAVTIAKASDFAFRIVTLDGDVITPQGSLTGGSKKTFGTSLLSRENEIKETAKNVEKLEAEKVSKANEYKNLLDNYNKVCEIVKEQTNNLHILEISNAKEAEIYNSFVLSLNDLHLQLNKVDGEIAKFNQIMHGIDNELSKLNNEDNSNDVNIANPNYSQFSELKSKKDEYSNLITNKKVEIASIESEIYSIIQDIDRLNIEIHLNLGNIEKSQTEKSNIEGVLNQFKDIEETSVSSVQYEKSFNDLKETKNELVELEKGKSELQSSLRQLDDEKMRLNLVVNDLQDKKYQQDLLITKIDTDIETMQERVWTEYELTYSSASEYREDNFDIKSGLQNITKIRKDIQNLGNINVNAIEDLKLLEERHGQMYSQAQDLIKAENEIKQIIQDLANEMSEKFEAEFNKINENFMVVFKELFGGGNARLELVDQDNVLESGVEIIAEPPEKKLHNTQLLSGGEKALVAIAILFAILKSRPMPFCLLDEIEAALDEANVFRFIQYLKKYSHETQFIVITHKKPTMEYSDVLFGITMEEKGVSKVVSVKLNDAVKMAEVK